MSRRATVIPCLQIEAGDWIHKPEVRHWLENAGGGVASWSTWDTSTFDESVLYPGDIFTLYDHGDGPDNPEMHPAGSAAMPGWLWAKIENAVRSAGLTYCIVRLLDIVPDEEDV